MSWYWLASAGSLNDSAASHDYSVDSNLASAKEARGRIFIGGHMQSCFFLRVHNAGNGRGFINVATLFEFSVTTSEINEQNRRPVNHVIILETRQADDTMLTCPIEFVAFGK